MKRQLHNAKNRTVYFLRCGTIARWDDFLLLFLIAAIAGGCFRPAWDYLTGWISTAATRKPDTQEIWVEVQEEGQPSCTIIFSRDKKNHHHIAISKKSYCGN